MRKLLGLLLLGSLLTIGAAPQHALYLSLTEISYEPGTGSLTMGVRVFSDDLEDGLREHFGESTPVIGLWEDPHVAEKVKSYLLDQIILTPSPQNWALVSLYQQNDATWIEFTAEGGLQENEWKVDSNLLLDVYDTQRNIIKIFWRDQLRVASLDKNDRQATFSWE